MPNPNPQADTLSRENKSLKEQLAKAQGIIAKQKRDLANQHMDRASKLDHILRLRRMLVNALENGQGWHDDARRETQNTMRSEKGASRDTLS